MDLVHKFDAGLTNIMKLPREPCLELGQRMEMSVKASLDHLLLY